MKTCVYKRYGAADVLAYSESAKPRPAANEVLIKIHATSVTVADCRVRGFRVPAIVWVPARLALGLWRPKRETLGMELSGNVEAVGNTVSLFKKGDAVFAATLQSFGAYAEYICLSENGPIAIKPANISYQQAAVLPVGARTALHHLQQAKVSSGQHVLVYGASGSVGSYAVQLAKHFGAQVTAVCSGANAAWLESLGADRVVDYTTSDFSNNEERYDVVFEAVDKSPVAACMRILKRGGAYINVTTPLPNLRIIWERLFNQKRFYLGLSSPETPEALCYLRGLIENGELQVNVDKNFQFEQIREAHRYVDLGHKKGNVSITIIQDQDSTAG